LLRSLGLRSEERSIIINDFIKITEVIPENNTTYDTVVENRTVRLMTEVSNREAEISAFLCRGGVRRLMKVSG
jgi:hypothetical protein